MKQISKHDVNKLTADELVKETPFEITNDGKVIAIVLSAYDVNRLKQKPKAGHDVNNELRFSKARQAKGMMPND